MTRNAMPQFDSFDPEVIEAARDVAARAGVPLETWIASVVPQPPAQGSRRHRRRHRQDLLREGGQDPRHEPLSHEDQRVATWREDVHHGRQHEARAASGWRDPAAEMKAPGLSALMNRLDSLDRAMTEGRHAAQAAEGRRLEEIEARIDRALNAGPVHQVTERLGDIERRMSQLGEQVASARPPGRRGKPAAVEVRDAVREIRQRRRELAEDEQGDGSVVAGMRRDIARRLESDPAAPSDAIAELQHEAARLREATVRLTTAQDVGVLEQAVVSLAGVVDRASTGADLGAIAAPVDRIRAQVERLAQDAADDVHVAADVQRLTLSLDAAASSNSTDLDRPALDSLLDEVDEIRRMVGSLAGAERIQALAQGLRALSTRIAQLRASRGENANLRSPIEESRGEVEVASPAALAQQIQGLAAKVDTQHARTERYDGANGGVEAATADGASIQAMLHSLAEKVERVGRRGGVEGLDALEKQTLSLADRIEASRGSDATLSGLERTMGELLRQVAALREAARSEAADELPARSPLSQTLKDHALAGANDPGEIGLLRAGLADLQARQTASDQRLGATLDGVQSALDRLVNRLGPTEGPATARPSLDERLMASSGLDAPRPVRGPRELAIDPPRVEEGLLEPGAARPVREAAADVGLHEPLARRAGRERPRSPTAEPVRGRPEVKPDGDIKASFIAAARRAAQAAQAELAAEAPAERRARASAAAPAGKGEGRLARLRAEIDRRRRPLLLGLAAIVLALGAVQAIGMRPTEEAPRRVATVQAPAAEAGAGKQTRAEMPKEAAKEVPKETVEAAKPAPKPAVADPQTTQALPTPPGGEAKPAPGKSPVPQVAGMSALSSDLGNIPVGLAKVRQAALDGDGTAVWELAAREADGRGMPRDLAVAAKLYEKLASAGYAPAQYKLAGHHEKGSGVVRDLAQAKLWYGRAAEQGHARAMHNLAVIYAENPGANGKPDFASAASWFRQGAEYGIRDSQYNLAVLYARGLGLTQDLVQSYAWFSAAAAQGDDDAGKKRDDVATKLSPADLASAKSLAATFKPRRIDAAVNEPPAPRDAITAPMSLLGAPTPNANAFTPPSRKTI